jgi:hypothetical protein
MCNERYRDIYSLTAPAIRPGATYEDILRYGVWRAASSQMRWGGRRPGWPTGCKSTRKPRSREQHLSNGRWLRLMDAATPDGGRAGLCVDITDQKRQQAELDRARREAEIANRAKSAFLASMSHEIRTPMNGVVGMADLLSETELDGDQRLFADTIKASAEALLVIINDVLDYSKIEAGKLELFPEPFDLERCIHDVVLLMRPKLAGKPVDIAVDYDLFLPIALCRRSGAAAPGAGQSGRQCGEVHRCGPCADPGHRGGPRRRPPAPACHGGGYRHRHSRRSGRQGVRRVCPGFRPFGPPVRGHRAGPGDLAPADRDDGRRNLGRIGTGPGLGLRLPAGVAGGRRGTPAHTPADKSETRAGGRRSGGQPHDPRPATRSDGHRGDRLRQRRRGAGGGAGGRLRPDPDRPSDAGHGRGRAGKGTARGRQSTVPILLLSSGAGPARGTDGDAGLFAACLQKPVLRADLVAALAGGGRAPAGQPGAPRAAPRCPGRRGGWPSWWPKTTAPISLSCARCSTGSTPASR